MRCAVVGAGLVGLAIARELQHRGVDVVWREADERLGSRVPLTLRCGGYQSVVEAFAHGLDVRRADVRSIARAGAGWRVEDVAADAVVVAAGVDTRSLLAPSASTCRSSRRTGTCSSASRSASACSSPASTT